MILIHIYPYVALNAVCEMSRAETGEREREREKWERRAGTMPERNERDREREKRSGRRENRVEERVGGDGSEVETLDRVCARGEEERQRRAPHKSLR